MRGVSGLALAAALAIACFWAVGAATPPAPRVMQGDTLGPQAGETDPAYLERAEASLDHDEASFALVSFAHPLDAEEAAVALQPAPRVSAVLETGRAPIVVPEPSIGNLRIDVLRSATTQPITGAVVHAPRAALRQIQADYRVRAVEMLPADAVWGAFALTPSVTGGRV